MLFRSLRQMTASTRFSETGPGARTNQVVSVAADGEAEVISEAAEVTAGDVAKAAVATLVVADEMAGIRRRLLVRRRHFRLPLLSWGWRGRRVLPKEKAFGSLVFGISGSPRVGVPSGVGLASV